ncbi:MULTISPECIES: methyl-accepting chemotaxis protein [unclassified Acidovorax]|uniref:methyl-accepting chemotaxis protein n=1 Tax=unclassified Acidovorax TaxID=2684926 RepID=UPI001C44A8CA|nr:MULTISPECIES: methyl-accepting chemotaxis protein [unclassified Acidovorax]MBV7461626.1 HAMP domain-containing protein [Acidovorax sp. sif0632]MBV7466270.1 HAMP domain-containing protein [Acidovorax sp. sif0613]
MNLFSLMRQFTIRLRMLGAIGVVLGLLGLLGGAGMLGMFRIHNMSQDFMDHSFAEVGYMAELRGEMGAIRQFEKDMIIGYEKPEAVKAAHAKWLESQDKAKKIANKFLEGEEDSDNPVVRNIVKRLDSYRELFAHVARQLEASGYDTATIANRMSGKAVAEFAEADKLMAELDSVLRAEVAKSVEQQGEVSEQTKWLFVLAVLITVVVVVPTTLMNMNSICRPLEDARRMAQAIAGGDLSQNIAAEGKDEVADLQRALRDMQQGLGALVAQVRDASGNIATASQEIATGNQDLSQRTEQTASNAQEAVSSLSQLTATVQQTASSSQMANQLAASASQMATHGGGVVQQAVASMHEISTSSRKIGDIIGLIDSIAFQTNILALNAAVEAARAGEQGRGFAVVASEVRSLAQRSAAAASDIKGLIQNSVTAVDGGVRHVEEAGTAMKDIVSSVQRVGDIIGEITAAASEQSAGIGQVNGSVGEIDRMTQQNAALVEESAAAAESLREQAARLSQVVQQFHLADSMGHGQAHRSGGGSNSVAAPYAEAPTQVSSGPTQARLAR